MEKSIININDISKLPHSLEYNGRTFELSMWISAWNKLVVGYRDLIINKDIISIVVDKEANISYDLFNDFYKEQKFKCVIITVKSIEDAFNVLYKFVSKNKLDNLDENYIQEIINTIN